LSRRKAAEAVKNGRVKVNGNIVTDPSISVSPGDIVLCDGIPAPAAVTRYYIALNKPAGYMSSNHDRFAEKLAVDLIGLPEKARLFSAGRLDVESSGLLIFSNDGDFINLLTHPSFGITKSYTVTVNREVSDKYLELFQQGINDDGEILKALDVKRIGTKKYSFVLGEGKKRHIRRMIAAAGAGVVTLTRVRHGNILLGNLPSGKWRHLTPEEIKTAGEIIYLGLPEPVHRQ
jgi:pseudouridine synthase